MTRLTAISPEHFTKKAWRRSSDYLFANKANIIPVVAAEVKSLVPTMPMGFVQCGNTFQMVAITSLLPDTNLFVAPDGRWLSSIFQPAFVLTPFALLNQKRV